MMKQRPSARNPKMMVSAFAMAVTCEGNQPKDWIARKGQFSLQNTLERIIPEVILAENEKRYRMMTKIATAAFLKVLENKCGFRRIRIRRQGLDRDAGDLVFCRRRWLRPSNPADRQVLERNYESLCFAFPCFSSCPLPTFLDTLENVAASWSVVLSKIRSRMPDAKLCSTTNPSAAPTPPPSHAPPA
eukprot:CAMPEP_0113697362 /NCGR_PEP_ID=MMETSP0038_2-20120614/22093_1 /TAXON_ID=2898 /ORGANISM="Cryptomonas paramecium" /LENGTH=187 /DNA_ID=CAMNT_0000620367 /DNA_START=33 /DNA_END=592 /DNA_ORIENTATION=+ /assembly_acc=CAM_ASM_000170